MISLLLLIALIVFFLSYGLNTLFKAKIPGALLGLAALLAGICYLLQAVGVK